MFHPKDFSLEFFHIYRHRHISYLFHDLYEEEREISQLKIFHHEDKCSLFGENVLFHCEKTSFLFKFKYIHI